MRDPHETSRRSEPRPAVDAFVTLLKAYRRQGYRIRTGLNPLYVGDPDAPFTRLLDADGATVAVGGGIAPQEIHFLQALFASGLRPRHILIIGNAFGWSAAALALLVPDATVVALDAGVEGEATRVGADLTRRIATAERLDVRVVQGLSPVDVAHVVDTQFGAPRVDFALIDGLHTNEQLVRDFDAVAAQASPDCVFALHDVLSWHMTDAFQRLDVGASRQRRILTRCPSGMGLVFPNALEPSARDVVDAFCDDTVDIAAFHRSLGASPDDPGPRLAARLAPCWRSRRVVMSDVYEMEGRAELAADQIARAVEEGRGDAEAQSQIASCLIERGRWVEAESALGGARDLAPTWAVLPQQLGCIARAMGRHEVARASFWEASRLRPDWASPVFDLGLVAQRLEGDASARPYFARAARLDPTWAPPVYHQGLVVKTLEGDRAAVPYLERASRLDPTWAEPWRELGAVQYRLGADASAIRSLERSVSLEPTAAAHHLLGLARARRDGPDAAIASLERAVELDPRRAFLHFDLGVTHRALGDREAALRHLRRATSLAPDWAPAWFEAAATAADLARWSDAAGLLSEAARLGLSDVALWERVGRASFEARDWSTAFDSFRRVRRLRPESRAPQKEIAICLRELGRLTESASVLCAELDLRPGWAGARFELGLTYEAGGDRDRAERTFGEVVEQRPDWSAPREALARLRRDDAVSGDVARRPVDAGVEKLPRTPSHAEPDASFC